MQQEWLQIFADPVVEMGPEPWACLALLWGNQETLAHAGQLGGRGLVTALLWASVILFLLFIYLFIFIF